MTIDEPVSVSAMDSSLRRAWQSVAGTSSGPRLRATDGEPGPIALRARWHYMRGLGDAPEFSAEHRVSEEQWRHEIDLESEGDLALVRQTTDVARDRFGRLYERASHPVVRVQALIGLADAARQDDEIDGAVARYREAEALAAEIGFEFGVLRARLPQAHTIRRSGSAEQMLAIATDCEDRARRLSDRVYIANALAAQGEALELLRRPKEAVQVLYAAMNEFARVGSPVGEASAGIRLLDVHRRREDAESILELAPRVMRAIEATQQLQEAVDVYDVLAYAYLKREAYDDAVDACRAGVVIAGQRYPRAAAHLRMTEGLALRRLNRLGEAVEVLLRAYEYFATRDGDEGTEAHCLGHLADCAEDMDNNEAVELRMRAIDAVEQIRSRQIRPRWQQEYRDRFDTVYRRALQTMIRFGDASAFAAVFESLWGRRLPGVTAGVRLNAAADPLLIAQLLARHDQARRAGLPPGLDRAERLRRALGRTANGAALPEMYADATDPSLAASYRPLTRSEGAALLEGIRADVAVLLMAELPGRPGWICWLARAPQAEPVVGQLKLSAEELVLIDTYAGEWPADAQAAMLEPLARLLPDEIVGLPAGTALQLVPLERLWSLPWLGLPMAAGPLGMIVDLMLSPSLTLARAGTSLGPARPAGTTTTGCIGPGVRHHDLYGLDRDRVGCRSVEAASRAHVVLLRGSRGPVVVVAHGRPAPGLGHYLEMAADLLLTPTEMLAATPPESLALIACWGARVPATSNGEPLTLATIALARGARQILTTVGELGDCAQAAALVNDVLTRATADPWPSALRWALCRRAEELRDEPLINWATLVAIGGW